MVQPVGPDWACCLHRCPPKHHNRPASVVAKMVDEMMRKMKMCLCDASGGARDDSSCGIHRRLCRYAVVKPQPLRTDSQAMLQPNVELAWWACSFSLQCPSVLRKCFFRLSNCLRSANMPIGNSHAGDGANYRVWSDLSNSSFKATSWYSPCRILPRRLSFANWSRKASHMQVYVPLHGALLPSSEKSAWCSHAIFMRWWNCL